MIEVTRLSRKFNYNEVELPDRMPSPGEPMCSPKYGRLHVGSSSQVACSFDYVVLASSNDAAPGRDRP